MALVGADMAEAIRSGMGLPTPVSAQLIGWGSGVVQHIQAAAIVSNLPGTLTGITASGAPLSNGAGAGGLILGMSGAAMAALVQSSAGYPSVTAQLSAFCNQMVLHIQTMGLVSFASGNITGVCTSTPLSPGPLVAGAGTNGTISGLSGTILASAVHAAAGYPGGTSGALIQFCTAIVNYIMANAQVQYPTGTVNGLCPAGGGPLSAGAGSGGNIL